MVQEYVEADLRRDGPPGVTQAHVIFGRIDFEGSVDRRALRAALRRQRGHLRRCVEVSPLYEAEGSRTLVVVLERDAQGSVRATLREGTLGGTLHDRCVTRALEGATAQLPRGATVTLSLRLAAG